MLKISNAIMPFAEQVTGISRPMGQTSLLHPWPGQPVLYSTSSRRVHRINIVMACKRWGGHDGVQRRTPGLRYASSRRLNRAMGSLPRGHVSSPRACSCACVYSLTTHPHYMARRLCRYSAQVRRYVVAVPQWPKEEGNSSP